MGDDNDKRAHILDVSQISRCYFEHIKLFLDCDDATNKDKAIIIYDKDNSKAHNKYYFLSNANGKKIKIDAKRGGDLSCPSKAIHENIGHLNTKGEKETPINNSKIQEVSLKYDPIGTAIGKGWWHFADLPLFNHGSEFYKEEKFNFSACDKRGNSNINIVIYPDIIFSVSFDISLSTEQEEGTVNSRFNKPKSTYSTDATKGEGKLSANIKYGESTLINLSADENKSKTVATIITIVSGFKKIANVKKSIEDYFPKSNKIIKSPFTWFMGISLSFSYNWQYCTDDDHLKIGTCHTVTIKLNISGGVKIDIISLAGVFPALTPVVRLRDFLDNISKASKRVKVGFTCDLTLTLEGEAGVEALTFSDIKSNEDVPYNFGITFSAELKITITGNGVAWDWQLIAEGYGSAKLSAGLIFNFKYTKGKGNSMESIIFSFPGLELKVGVKIAYGSHAIEDDPDNQHELVNLDRKLVLGKYEANLLPIFK